DADNGGGGGGEGGGKRPLPGGKTGHGQPPRANTAPKSEPALGTHFQGLNLHHHRLAHGGTPISRHPPGPRLFPRDGVLLESVNDVLQVYNTSGTPLLNGGQAVDLNTFYGYIAAINRTTNARGPSLTDPVCIYDQAIGRFVQVVLTLDHVGTTASTNG